MPTAQGPSRPPLAEEPRWSDRLFAAGDRWERLGKIHVVLVTAAGAGVTLWALGRLMTGPTPWLWVLGATATLLVGPLTLKVRSLHATVSMSDACVLALVVFFGPAPAIATIALDGVLTAWRADQPTRYRTVFQHRGAGPLRRRGGGPLHRPVGGQRPRQPVEPRGDRGRGLAWVGRPRPLRPSRWTAS